MIFTKTVTKRSKAMLHLQFLMLICALVFSTLANGQPPARMGISPDRYQITFDERGGETQALMIHNLSNSPMKVKLNVSNWELDDNNRVKVIGPTEKSLDQWIVINPLSVTIPPGTPQTIRWAIMPRLKPEPGEYRALVFIEEDTPVQTGEGEGTQVRMQMRYGLPIYAQVGERTQSAELNSIDVDRDNNRVFLDITNTGNSHGRLAGTYGIWRATEFPGTDEALSMLRAAAGRPYDQESFVMGQLPGTVILPENRRSIPLDIPLPLPGDYVVQFNGEFAQLQITDVIQVTQPGT
jgi:P pilus assembly chaperone PapD